jgi:hypothetical protein
MFEEILHYIIVVAISMFKFAMGPLAAQAYGMHPIETIICAITGMMLTVFILTTYFGETISDFLKRTLFKNRPVFSKQSRRTIRVWNRFGLWGIALLTPPLFTPIGGTLIAISFGEKAGNIIMYMFVSALFWGTIFTFFIEEINKLIHQL